MEMRDDISLLPRYLRLLEPKPLPGVVRGVSCNWINELYSIDSFEYACSYKNIDAPYAGTLVKRFHTDGLSVKLIIDRTDKKKRIFCFSRFRSGFQTFLTVKYEQ
jgi:hypothetical protein